MNTEELAIKLQKTEDRSVRNEGRIKKLETEHEVLHKLVTNVAVLAEQIKTMNTNVQNLAVDVEDIKTKPAKRWEGLVGSIVGAVVGILVGYIFTKFGM